MTWPGITNHSDYNKALKYGPYPGHPGGLAHLVPRIKSHGHKLMASLLAFSGKQRISAADGLKHSYFSNSCKFPLEVFKSLDPAVSVFDVVGVRLAIDPGRTAIPSVHYGNFHRGNSQSSRPKSMYYSSGQNKVYIGPNTNTNKFSNNSLFSSNVSHHPNGISKCPIPNECVQRMQLPSIPMHGPNPIYQSNRIGNHQPNQFHRHSMTSNNNLPKNGSDPSYWLQSIIATNNKTDVHDKNNNNNSNINHASFLIGPRKLNPISSQSNMDLFQRVQHSLGHSAWSNLPESQRQQQRSGMFGNIIY